MSQQILKYSNDHSAFFIYVLFSPLYYYYYYYYSCYYYYHQ